jgi:hypothetical protein
MKRSASPRPPRCRHLVLSLPLVVAALLVMPHPVQPQDVRYKEVTTTEFAGFMGSAMRMSGENMGPDTTVNWVKGLKLRVDKSDGRASEILDLGSMEFTSWHHVDSTYYVVNFQQFMQSADSRTAEAREAMTEDERARMNSVETSLEVDRTGETRMINGWEAERVIMTVTLEPSTEGMSEEEMERDPMAAVMGQGSMVMLSELWVSDDLPGYREMREAMGDGAGDFATGSGGMESLAAGYPQMAALTEEMREQMQGLDGATVRSTVYTVTAPANVPLNRDSILAMSDEPLPQGPDLSELMARAMGNAGEDAARGAISNALGGMGGLGRLLGGRNEEEEEEPPTVVSGGAGGTTVISRIITEIIDVESLSLSDSDFQPPVGYREREWPGVG